MTDGAEHHIELLDGFADRDDPRQQAKVRYPLQEILVLGRYAVPRSRRSRFRDDSSSGWSRSWRGT